MPVAGRGPAARRPQAGDRHRQPDPGGPEGAPGPSATCTPTPSPSSRPAGTGASTTSPAATSSPTSRRRPHRQGGRGLDRALRPRWVMARGDKGYFGGKFDSWYIWLPMCLLFVAPFFDPRRPFRMLHLDLLVLVGGFGVSHWFFNQGEIGTSVPLVYPVFAYLLARMLYAGLRPRRPREPLVPLAPIALLVAGIVLLGGFRIGLDVATGKVGDVGYGSAIGATRVLDGKAALQGQRRPGPALRHLRAGQLPRLRAVREGLPAFAAGDRDAGRLQAVRRASGDDRLRPAHDRRPVRPGHAAAEGARRDERWASRSPTPGSRSRTRCSR